MNEEFRKLVDQLPGLLERLVSSPALHRSNLRRLPERGVYVLYEAKEPIYAGRSNRMKERILEHGRPSSRHNSATFAFNLAGEDARKKRIDVSMSRDQLQDDPAFARRDPEVWRVRALRCWEDPVDLTFFRFVEEADFVFPEELAISS